MSWPTVSKDPAIQQFYESMREKGQSHNMADMLAHRTPCRGMTDDVFVSGQGTLDKQFGGDEKTLARLTKKATKAGWQRNNNDVYCGALAEFEGDPDAFIPHDAVGHIKRVAQKKGINVTSDDKVLAQNYSEPLRDPLEGKVQIQDLVSGTV
jgi:hypothetical protein